MRFFLQIFSLFLIFTSVTGKISFAAPGVKKIETENSVYSIKLNQGKTLLKVTRKAADTWACSVGGKRLTARIDKNNLFLFKGSSIFASGVINKGKLKLKDTNGAPYIQIKFTTEKIKIKLSSNIKVWEFKRKSNNVLKVKVGRTKYGKVKYYADKQKTKAKDASGNIIAESKSLERGRSFALGAYLIANADETTKAFLMMILLANGW